MNRHDAMGLRRTRYDRRDLQIGVVHLGYGAFHRAHQAVYLDDCMEACGDLRWGVAAVNLRACDSADFAAAAAVAQADDGFLLKTLAPGEGPAYRMVRSHAAFADWARSPVEAAGLLARDSVHAVTVTVTEGGYHLDPHGGLDLSSAEIAAEIGGGPGVSVYGYLAQALETRMAASGAPISVLCCDNIRGNGRMLERNLLAYLRAAGRDGLADWVQRSARFPCSMVDRITPRRTDALDAEISAAFPGRDLAPVHSEAFSQWVLENRFAGPFPDLGAAGVEVVEDVTPHEEAKIRILNGGHVGTCYHGALAGLRTFDEAMADPRTRAHFDAWEMENILPGIGDDLLPLDTRAYLDLVTARFENAGIADNLERIGMDGWAKVRQFVQPTLQACLERGMAPLRGYDSVGAWVVCVRRSVAGRLDFSYADSGWDCLEPLIAPGREGDFAADPRLWADLPESHPEFVPGITSAIERMNQQWPA